VAKQLTQKERSFRKELLQQLITLSSTGFGLVAALAWNEAIQTVVNQYIKVIFPDEYGIISKLFYAILITCLAVLITFQLSRLASKFGSK
jgi:uncharacterized membrane protein